MCCLELVHAVKPIVTHALFFLFRTPHGSISVEINIRRYKVVHVDKVPVAIGELHVRVALGDQVLDGVLGKVLVYECHVIFATVEAKDGDLEDHCRVASASS